MMEIMTGITACPGLAIANAVVIDAEEYVIPRKLIEPPEAGAEVEQLNQAFLKSMEELERQREQVSVHHGKETAAIFDWPIGVLTHGKFKQEIVTLIRKRHYSAAHAVGSVIQDYKKKFSQMKDPVLAERVHDVIDLERRLIRNLLGEIHHDIASLTEPFILVSHELTASQAAHLIGSKVAGVATDAGGLTSHGAILLRSVGLPAVIGLGDISRKVSGGETIVVDGLHELVLIDPDETTLKEYRESQTRLRAFTLGLSKLADLPPETRDGCRVELLANIEFPSETQVAINAGADGIGLYRTEFLFVNAATEPTEMEQFESYKQVVLGARGKPVTIRTMDLGADKCGQSKKFPKERNPMLGLRSLRWCLENLDDFKTQLRAILRASALGNIQVMFPMIIGLLEFRQANMALRDAMEDLEENGVAFNRHVPVGMMMETPAAAMMCQKFVKEAGFVSIGTNDLVQYTLAVDRGNERVGHLYTASHPAILRCLRDVIRICRRYKVSCSLCGEMAGEPKYTLLLLGLGLRKFSMAPNHLPEIKQVIRRATLEQAQRLARRALTLETDSQVDNLLRDELRTILPEMV